METLPGHQQHTPLIAAPAGMEQSGKFDFWGMLSRRKWIVFILFVGGLLAAAGYYYQAETIYESSAKIVIEPKSRLGLDLARTEINRAFDTTQTSHGDRIDSPVFIQNCFTTKKLFSLSSFAGMNEEEIVYEVEANLEIEADRLDPDIYYLTYTGSDPDDCGIVLNHLIEEYEKELESKHKGETKKIVDTFMAIRTSLKDEYDKKSALVVNAQKKYDAVPLNSRTGQTYEQADLAQLQEHLKSVESELEVEKRKLEKVELMSAEGENKADIIVWLLVQNRELLRAGKESDTGVVGISKERQVTMNRLENLKMQKEIGSTKFGPKHPTMMELDQQIGFWEEYLETGTVDEATGEVGAGFVSPAEMVRRYVVELEIKIVQLDQQRNNVERRLEGALARVIALKDIQDEIDSLIRQRTKTELFFDEAEKIVTQFTQNSENSAEQSGYIFGVLFQAKAGSPIWPHLPIVLGIGGLIGSLLGLGLGYLVDIADKTFRSPDEITKQLGLPLIGHIPVISNSKRTKIENSLIDPVVCSFHRPKSQSAEAFRAIRTALFFNTQGKAHSVIQVTSPTPGDGKSTVACNIAVSIAQSGKRVLIVDGDMRRPTMHHLFGIKSQEGFASVLAGDSRWEDCVYECEEIEGLSVLPCGAKPSNPAELITSPRVKQLINEMRQKYDFVIIDTPPLLAVTDPCPVAARVDGVILTLRIKKNVKVSAERSAEILHGLGAGIVGVVVNGVGVQTGYGSQYSYGAYRAGYSYNGYGYGYGYGYGNTGKYYEEDAGSTGRQTRPPRRIEGPANGAPVPTHRAPVNRE